MVVAFSGLCIKFTATCSSSQTCQLTSYLMVTMKPNYDKLCEQLHKWVSSSGNPFFYSDARKKWKKNPSILFPCNDRIFKSPICFWHLIFVQVFSFYYIFNKCSEHDFTVLKESHWTKSETYFKFLGDEVQKSFYWWQELCDSGQNTQDLFFSSQRQGWDTALR